MDGKRASERDQARGKMMLTGEYGCPHCCSVEWFDAYVDDPNAPFFFKEFDDTGAISKNDGGLHVPLRLNSSGGYDDVSESQKGIPKVTCADAYCCHACHRVFVSPCRRIQWCSD
jgi:hypothetical protein